MKLIRIEGEVWELTTLQSGYADTGGQEETLKDKNERAIFGMGWHRGCVRPLANHGVRSKAKAIIETEVNHHPHQMEYDIYHNSKGFFCKVQGSRVFLHELIHGLIEAEK